MLGAVKEIHRKEGYAKRRENSARELEISHENFAEGF